MDISNNEITEEQWKELDKVLKEIKEGGKGGYPCRGDDEAMIASVTNAANYYNGKPNTFLEDIVHIKGLYD